MVCLLDERYGDSLEVEDVSSVRRAQRGFDWFSQWRKVEGNS